MEFSRALGSPPQVEGDPPRSHAPAWECRLRRSASRTWVRVGTPSVRHGIPTRSMGTRGKPPPGLWFSTDCTPFEYQTDPGAADSSGADNPTHPHRWASQPHREVFEPPWEKKRSLSTHFAFRLLKTLPDRVRFLPCQCLRNEGMDDDSSQLERFLESLMIPIDNKNIGRRQGRMPQVRDDTNR